MIEAIDPSKSNSTKEVVLSLDEFEVIKRIDYEHMNQSNCAKHMHVSRTTVQRIYVSARQKLALALIEKRPLEVGGGVVEALEKQVAPDFCTMMIAIAVDNDQLALIFGKAETLHIYDVANGRIMQSRELIDTTHLKHERAPFLKRLGIDHVLVQCMGKSMYNHFLRHGIQVVKAQSPNIEEALRLFLVEPAVKRALNPCQICQ